MGAWCHMPLLTELFPLMAGCTINMSVLTDLVYLPALREVGISCGARHARVGRLTLSGWWQRLAFENRLPPNGHAIHHWFLGVVLALVIAQWEDDEFTRPLRLIHR
jgi:hypothetical protein